MTHTPSTSKDHTYYHFDKARIAAFIAEGPHKVLDVGCAAGRLGQKLREQGKAMELVGIEVFDAPAREAAQCYDKVCVDDIESMNLSYEEYFDYVVCGDVLEHLRDPWAALLKLNRALKPGGILLASTPNVRYWRVIRDLALLGRWEYVDSGIMDSTHLRFFTRHSFQALIQSGGFDVVFDELWVFGKKQGAFNKVTGGLFEEFLGSQLMAKAVKIGDPRARRTDGPHD